MSDFWSVVESYFQVILNERFWSWSIVAILYLIAGLMVRGWFLKGLLSNARNLPGKQYREVRKAYLKYSVGGWICFVIPLIIIVLLWNQEVHWPMEFGQLLLSGLGVFSFVLSIMLHQNAVGRAALATMKQLLDTKEMHEYVAKNP